MFLATLQLANNGNVDIADSRVSERAAGHRDLEVYMDTMKVKLLSEGTYTPYKHRKSSNDALYTSIIV